MGATPQAALGLGGILDKKPAKVTVLRGRVKSAGYGGMEMLTDSHIDQKTLNAYDQKAGEFTFDWHAQTPPEDLYDLVRRFFLTGRTADVGSGSGRDAAWLQRNGFEVTGYEPSLGLLREARRLYPEICFHQAALPGLDEIAPGSFSNVLCETVLMHLPRVAIPLAVRRLMDILEYGGVLYLSWRVTKGSDERDAAGRLYTAFEAPFVLQQLSSEHILHNEEVVSLSSARRIHKIIVRKATR